MPPALIKEIGLQGYEMLAQTHKGGVTWLQVRPQQERSACPRCGSGHLHSKGRYQRCVRHLDCFGKPTQLQVQLQRWRCVDCGRTFAPPLPGIKGGRHSSEPFRAEVYQRHHDGACGTTAAKRSGVSASTVERIYREHTARKARERQRLECPTYLGIDEHVLHRGKRYVTTFCDLKNHKVFDLAHGRSASELAGFLSQLDGREKVKVICIDLCSAYRAMIQQWFPNAKIVADRFHAVRIVMQHCCALAAEIAPEIKGRRGGLRVLRKRPENLTDRQREQLEALLVRHPALRPIYEKMRAICDLLNLKTQSARRCRQHARRLLTHIEQLRRSGFDALNTLAKTLQSWLEPLARMWRFAKNNGITEGFHRKMKLIQRRAYGFRSFHNYRLRVIAQCG